jgi:hypothetical protein
MMTTQSIDEHFKDDITRKELEEISEQHLLLWAYNELDVISRMKEAAIHQKTEITITDENELKVVRLLKSHGRFEGIRIEGNKMVWSKEEEKKEPLPVALLSFKDMEKTPIPVEDADDTYRSLRTGDTIARLFDGTSWYMAVVDRHDIESIKLLFTDGDTEEYTMSRWLALVKRQTVMLVNATRTKNTKNKKRKSPDSEKQQPAKKKPKSS